MLQIWLLLMTGSLCKNNLEKKLLQTAFFVFENKNTRIFSDEFGETQVGFRRSNERAGRPKREPIERRVESSPDRICHCLIIKSLREFDFEEEDAGYNFKRKTGGVRR